MHTAYQSINSDLGHMCAKQQLDKTLKITFACLSRKSDEKEKRKKNSNYNCKVFAFHANTKNNIKDMKNIWKGIKSIIFLKLKEYESPNTIPNNNRRSSPIQQILLAVLITLFSVPPNI